MKLKTIAATYGRKMKVRFWEKVSVNEDGDCWEWQAAIGGVGYGAFSFQGQQVGAHRIAYLLHYGELPDGLDICHHCDNRSCCNPHHLFAGTRLDNVRDAIEKGRAVFPPTHTGESHPMAKLSQSAVNSIRNVYTGERGQAAELARKHNITITQILNIVNKVHWAEER